MDSQTENTIPSADSSGSEMPQNSNTNSLKRFKRFIALIFILIFVIGALSYAAIFLLGKKPIGRLPFNVPGKPKINLKVEKFRSENDFKSYISESEFASNSYFGSDLLQLNVPSAEIGLAPGGSFGSLRSPTLDSAPSRVSETNVQVKGIDEPDIVKTDGNSIYFSSQSLFYPSRDFISVPSTELGILPPEPQTAETKVIKAFPPSELGKESGISRTGNLLINNKKLIIFSGNVIYGYDVSDPKNPKESWKFELDSRNSVVASRLFDGKIYLVTQQFIEHSRPCPIPLGRVTTSITIPCDAIYHPSIPVPIDVTFNIVVLNPENGGVNEKTSFVGSSGTTVVYMSPNSVYVTYTYYESMVTFFYNFLSEKGQDLVSAEVLTRLRELQGYNISEVSKLTEVQLILEKYYSSLDADERKRIENEFQNRIEDYSKEHLRDFQKTAIVKLRNGNLSVAATGEVPGIPLNQFSLDEYKDNLRIATTVTGGLFSSSESVNDVYILSDNMSVMGKITDLGITERIYSARFVEDKGYLVTFRQIDPFYVLDLSDPGNPKKTGELKIPGFSSYLDPISKDKILGVGRENANVKLSLFDVSNPSNPTEVAKYSLSEYWSDVSNTHHAFLLDAKHEVFFIPGGASGYIFSYKNNNLELLKVVSDISAQRAVYLNDYMYIIGETKLVVLNEADWAEVNSLNF